MGRVRRAALLLAACFGAALLRAAETKTASGAAFLKLGVGARAAGMGWARTAAAEGASAVHDNPGGLAWLARPEASASHAAFMEGSRLDSLSYARPAGPAVLGASALFLSQPGLEGRGANRERTGAFQAADGAAALTLSRRAGDAAGAGINVRFFRQRLGEASAEGAALDAGVSWRTPLRGVRLGGVLSHMGPSVRLGESSGRLPTALTVGASYAPMPSLLFALDAHRPFFDGEGRVFMGLEFSPLPGVSLRAGQAFSALSGGKPDASPFSFSEGFGAGVGVSVSRCRVDYAFTPAGELGNQQRISVSVRF